VKHRRQGLSSIRISDRRYTNKSIKHW